MPDAPEPTPDDIAPLLRLGLEDAESTAQRLDATMRVDAPTPHTGSGGSRGWSPPSVEDLQKALPQYEISAFIARGGMGAVYKGTQKALKRPVAIKVLPPEIEDGDVQFAARFKHEAQAMAQLSHPNIVAVFDAGETPDGLLYFVMEYIEGTDVAQIIASEGQLDPQRAIQITTAVCEALSFAHEEGIIHRDIKPSNIMIDRRGRVKVADFGLAKMVNLESTLLTGTNMALGTADFIAPEAMIPGMKLDQRADIYAVGVMLYQMLTGSIPRGRFELPSGVVPRVDKAFDAVVDKAMQTDREKRYSSATEMKREVERVAQAGSKQDGSAGTPARTSPSGGEAVAKQAGKNGRAPLLIGAAAVVVLGLGGFFLMEEPTEAKGGSSVSPSISPPISQSSPSAPENWINALTPETNLVRKPAELTPEGLRLTGNRMMSHERSPRRDGALRIRTRFEPDTAGVQLRVRNALDDSQAYALHPGADGRTVLLRHLANLAKTGGVSRSRTLGEFPLPKPLEKGEEYELELRAEGSRFTVRLNGQALGEVRDTATAQGGFGIATASSAPVLVKSLEYLNLDGSPVSSPPPLQVSPSPSFPPGQWVKVLTKPEELDPTSTFKKQVRFQDGWLDCTGINPVPTLVVPGFTGKDCGVRLRVKIGPAITMPIGAGIQMRRTLRDGKAREAYNCVLSGLDTPGVNVSITLLDIYSKSSERLRQLPPSAALKPGEEFTLEFYAIGDQLHGRYNGHWLPVATDARLSERGGIAIQNPHLIRDVEVINLDGLSEAEAWKVVGLDE